MTNQTVTQAQDFAEQVKPLSAKQRQEINDVFVNQYTQDPRYGYDFMGEEGRFQHCDWQVYEGDLIVESHFRCDMPLVITGNLIVKGNYLDDAVGGVVVCGNIEVEKNILSEYPILVVGNTTAKGLICLHYNDYGCEFLGDVECDILYIEDRDVEISGKIKTQAYYGEYREDREEYENQKNYDYDEDCEDYEDDEDCEEDDDYMSYMQTKLKEELFEEEGDDVYFDIEALTELLADNENIYKETGKISKREQRIIETINNADKVLVLSDLKLNEIPAEVFTKNHLEELNLDRNHIEQLPTALAKLTNLKRLNVSHNRNIHIDAVCALENLEMLNLDHCAVRGESNTLFQLPLELGRLKNLKTLLTLSTNSSFANPQVIADLDNLENLSISGDYLLASSEKYIPQIAKMKHLKRLMIDRSVKKKEEVEYIKKTYSHCEILFVGTQQYYAPKTQKTIQLADVAGIEEIEQKAQTDTDYQNILHSLKIFQAI